MISRKRDNMKHTQNNNNFKYDNFHVYNCLCCICIYTKKRGSKR